MIVVQIVMVAKIVRTVVAVVVVVVVIDSDLIRFEKFDRDSVKLQK